MDIYGSMAGPHVVVSGHNDVIPLTGEFVSNASRVWADADGFFEGGSVIEVVSASALDTSDGTGARSVTVFGAGVTGELVKEDFVLSGTTPVAGLVKFQVIYAISVMSAGSGGVNAGVISARKATKNAMVTVVAGENFGSGPIFMCPNSAAYTLEIVRAATLTQDAEMHLMLYSAQQSLWYTRATVHVGSGSSRDWQDVDSFGMSAGDIFRIDAYADTAGAAMDVQVVLQRSAVKY